MKENESCLANTLICDLKQYIHNFLCSQFSIPQRHSYTYTFERACCKSPYCTTSIIESAEHPQTPDKKILACCGITSIQTARPDPLQLPTTVPIHLLLSARNGVNPSFAICFPGWSEIPHPPRLSAPAFLKKHLQKLEYDTTADNEGEEPYPDLGNRCFSYFLGLLLQRLWFTAFILFRAGEFCVGFALGGGLCHCENLGGCMKIGGRWVCGGGETWGIW